MTTKKVPNISNDINEMVNDLRYLRETYSKDIGQINYLIKMISNYLEKNDYPKMNLEVSLYHVSTNISIRACLCCKAYEIYRMNCSDPKQIYHSDDCKFVAHL